MLCRLVNALLTKQHAAPLSTSAMAGIERLIVHGCFNSFDTTGFEGPARVRLESTGCASASTWLLSVATTGDKVDMDGAGGNNDDGDTTCVQLVSTGDGLSGAFGGINDTCFCLLAVPAASKLTCFPAAAS